MLSRRRTRPPRVLYLAFYFPPSRASGVHRARATANYLAEDGWDVTTFTAPLRFLHEVVGTVDDELVSTVDHRIRVERPPMDMFRWEHDLRRFSWLRGTMPALAERMCDWREYRLFPERYMSWGLACVRRALRLHARHRFDLVLATGNPFASFAAAWLFRQLTGVPYALDYRDSWTLDLFTDGPAFPPEHPAWRWESRVVNGAASVAFVNDAIRGWYAQRHPGAAERMSVVPNGWDADVMDVARSAGGAEPTRATQFGYLGTLTNNQPVETMAEAFCRARAHPEFGAAELNIHGHLGFFRNAPAVLMKRLGLHTGAELTEDPEARDSGVRYRGPFSKTEVASIYRRNDVLVFLAGGGRYVTSGKIFEYMATGLPIVSVHAPDIAAREVLAGYPLWFNPGSLDVDAVARSMVAAGRAARDGGAAQRAAARRHADGYARAVLLAPWVARLRQLVRRPLPVQRTAAP